MEEQLELMLPRNDQDVAFKSRFFVFYFYFFWMIHDKFF